MPPSEYIFSLSFVRPLAMDSPSCDKLPCSHTHHIRVDQVQTSGHRRSADSGLFRQGYEKSMMMPHSDALGYF